MERSKSDNSTIDNLSYWNSIENDNTKLRDSITSSVHTLSYSESSDIWYSNKTQKNVWNSNTKNRAKKKKKKFQEEI